MADVQTERAFQKQVDVFLNRKTSVKSRKPLPRISDVGLGIKAPREALSGTYIGKKVPFTGNVSIRGCTERERPVRKPKYDPLEEMKNDPEFKEFLSLQRNVAPEKKGEQRYIWKDDITSSLNLDKGVDEDTEEPTDQVEATDQDKRGHGNQLTNKKKEGSKLDSLMFSVKLRNCPYKLKKSELKKFFAPLSTARVNVPAKMHGIAYASFKTESDRDIALEKHKSFLGGKQVDVIKSDLNQDKQKETTTNEAPKKKEYHVIKESVADTGRLYLRNLSYTVSSQDLEEHFAPYGSLTEIYLPIDGTTKKTKGFAFVSFMFPEHAIKAMDELDNKIFQGRLIHILPGESKPEMMAKANHLSSYKRQREEERLKEGPNMSSWNALFLGANAVSEVMAQKFDVKKSDLVADTTNKDSLAVRMALGETQIVNETKQFLISNGINLDSFTEGVKLVRSSTVILVKNLPVDTRAEEIKEIFERSGSVNRVLLPPYGVTAIVEMQEETEARTTFKKLSNFKLKHIPFFLEWAPIDVFVSKEKTNQEDVTSDETEKEPNEETTSPGKSSPEEPEATDGTSLFVKNLAFSTTDEVFTKFFEKAGKLVSAKVSRRAGTNLSNGYGFVTFSKARAADKALKTLQNTKLEGHVLQIQRSKSGPLSSKITQETSTLNKNTETTSSTTTTGQGIPHGCKIIARNVPFEATEKEVQEVFAAFGGIKSVRMPKKMTGTGTHRGFAFIEYNTKSDAERAFESLSGSTHLYGRRLVLEWAKEQPESKGEEEDPSLNQKSSLEGPVAKKLKKSELVSRLTFNKTE